MNISDIQELKRKGAYNKAIKEIDNYKTDDEIEIYTLDLIKADIYVYTGKFEIALDLLDGIPDLNEVGKHNESLLTGTVKSAALRGMGLIFECGELIKKYSLFIKSDLEFDLFILSRFYHESGNVFMIKGDLLTAIDKFDQSIPIRKKLKDNKGLASVYNKLALTHKMMGGYAKAKDFFVKSLKLDQKLGNIQSSAITLGNLGAVLYKLNKVPQAIDFMERSISELMKLGNDTFISYSIYNLFNCMLKVNKEVVLVYVGQMSEIFNKKENKDNLNIFVIYNLMQALVLKDGARGKEKYEAQDILSSLTIMEVDFKLKMDVFLNLIDLMLEELETYNYEEVMKEVTNYMKLMSELAKLNNSNRLFIESLIMEARFLMILKDVQGSFDLFKKATDIALKYEITDLISIIEKERLELEKELSSWNNLISSNISTINEINQNKFQKYMELVKDRMDEFSSSIKLSDEIIR